MSFHRQVGNLRILISIQSPTVIEARKLTFYAPRVDKIESRLKVNRNKLAI